MRRGELEVFSYPLQNDPRIMSFYVYANAHLAACPRLVSADRVCLWCSETSANLVMYVVG